MAKERVRIVVSGIVQGVFFRSYTSQKAGMLNLKGWVRNTSDGSVEIVAEGDRELLNELLQWSYHGPSSARVDHVDFSFEPYQGEFNSFGVRY
jgi:acylphosphatase